METDSPGAGNMALPVEYTAHIDVGEGFGTDQHKVVSDAFATPLS